MIELRDGEGTIQETTCMLWLIKDFLQSVKFYDTKSDIVEPTCSVEKWQQANMVLKLKKEFQA